jgi:hypothetical protein
MEDLPCTVHCSVLVKGRKTVRNHEISAGEMVSIQSTSRIYQWARQGTPLSSLASLCNTVAAANMLSAPCYVPETVRLGWAFQANQLDASWTDLTRGSHFPLGYSSGHSFGPSSVPVSLHCRPPWSGAKLIPWAGPYYMTHVDGCCCRFFSR